MVVLVGGGDVGRVAALPEAVAAHTRLPMLDVLLLGEAQVVDEPQALAEVLLTGELQRRAGDFRADAPRDVGGGIGVRVVRKELAGLQIRTVLPGWNHAKNSASQVHPGVHLLRLVHQPRLSYTACPRVVPAQVGEVAAPLRPHVDQLVYVGRLAPAIGGRRGEVAAGPAESVRGAQAGDVGAGGGTFMTGLDDRAGVVLLQHDIDYATHRIRAVDGAG